MSNLQQNNRKIALGVFAAVFCMTALAFASVPLYNLFCRVTGYGGTTQVASAAPDTISDRIITVKFNADTARNLLWDFQPDIKKVEVHPGAKTLMAYRAYSRHDSPVAGTAVYNVSPPKAGKYFHKIECFCFAEQILNPGEEVSMPVLFYIDPAIEDDKSMRDVKTIVLSYSFFKTETEELDQALEDFYNQDDVSDGQTAGDG